MGDPAGPRRVRGTSVRGRTPEQERAHQRAETSRFVRNWNVEAARGRIAARQPERGDPEIVRDDQVRRTITGDPRFPRRKPKSSPR